MNQKPSISYPAQFVILLALVGFCLICGSFIVGILGSNMLHVPLLRVPELLNQREFANISRFLNTLASCLAFLVPALLLARIVNPKPFSYLGFNGLMSSRQALLVLFLTLAGILLSGALGAVNEQIPLSAKWLAKAKAMEEAYRATMLTMATMKNFTDYLLTLLTLAIAPAIFEEVLFRGAFQRIFIGWTRNAWAGIIITSILFSAIHFSYFGFLPRVALGMILGLIFYYGKNIWLNILLHFLNNALVVTQLYVAGRSGKPVEKTIDENIPVWFGLIGIGWLIFLFIRFRKESNRVLLAKAITPAELNIF